MSVKVSLMLSQTFPDGSFCLVGMKYRDLLKLQEVMPPEIKVQKRMAQDLVEFWVEFETDEEAIEFKLRYL